MEISLASALFLGINLEDEETRGGGGGAGRSGGGALTERHVFTECGTKVLTAVPYRGGNLNYKAQSAEMNSLG